MSYTPPYRHGGCSSLATAAWPCAFLLVPVIFVTAIHTLLPIVVQRLVFFAFLVAFVFINRVLNEQALEAIGKFDETEPSKYEGVKRPRFWSTGIKLTLL